MPRTSTLHRISLRVTAAVVVLATALTVYHPVSAAVGDCSENLVVTSQADLLALAADPTCLDETWTQAADITLTANPWIPMTGFEGTYDGNSFTISGLHLAGNNAGLFGVGMAGATFEDISIEVASATGGTWVGALVGWSTGSLTIRNVSVDVTGNTRITGVSEVGGIVGVATGPAVTIVDSHVNADVVGDTNVAGNYVGGLIGWATNGAPGSFVTISDSSVTGDVIGGTEVGGIIGSTSVEQITVTSTTVTGNVTGDTNVSGHEVGGLIGRTTNGAAGSFVTVTGGSVTGNVTGASKVGGVIGNTPVEDVTVTSTTVTGNVTGDTNVFSDYVGGLIGWTTNGGTDTSVRITDSHVIGNTFGSSRVGGAIGSTSALLVDVVASSVVGNVTGDTNVAGNYVGGLIGWTTSGAPDTSISVTISSVTGDVTGASEIGGFIGGASAVSVVVSNSHVVGDVTGDTNVPSAHIGGLIGRTSTGAMGSVVSMTESSIRGNVVGGSRVAGLLGSSPAITITIDSTSVTGNVTGDTNVAGNYVGGLIGWNTNGGTILSISDTTVTGNITGSTEVGGVVGSSPAAEITITTTHVNGNVTGDTNVAGNYVGGLIGWNTNGGTILSISDTTVTGNITGSTEVGGVVGSSPAAEITITTTHVNGNVTGDTNVASDYVGGLVGWNTNGATVLSISDTTVTGNVTGSAEVGGLVGNSPAAEITITTTVVSGDIRGVGDYVGGVIGRTTNGSTTLSVTDTTMIGNVSGVVSVGGVVGSTFAGSLSLTRSAVVGNITGDTTVSGDTVGGFLGFAQSSDVTIIDSFVRGTITAGTEAGGFIAWGSDDVTLTNSYFLGTIVASGSDRGSFIGKSTPGNLVIDDSVCTDVHCPAEHTVTADQLKSASYLSSRQWNMTDTWCIRPDLNLGFPTLRTIVRGALDATACRPVVVQIRRVTLDPNGGRCVDNPTNADVAHTKIWTSVFVGYRYLPAASDCTRPGHEFAGWADRTSPTTLRQLPLLRDPVDDELRYFTAQDLDLVAVWSPVIDDLVVFANFLCGPCTTAWLVYTTPPTVSDVSITVDSVRATCNQQGVVFGFSVCELTGLRSGSHTVALLPGGGTTPTSTTFVLKE